MSLGIKGLGENAQVVHLGDFFRYNKHPDWSLSLWCNPIQDKKSTRLANLPMLSRGKYINSSIRRYNRPDSVIILNPSYRLTATTLAEFPELSRFESVKKIEGVQNAFRLDTDKISNIIIPQLELARAIFLMNSYLCRACMNTETLQLEFDVRPAPEINHVDIQVLKTATFPKSAFNQSGTKQLLAWLLTSLTAMDSYRSIYQHYQNNRQLKGQLETWRFSFEPPPMTNWQLHVKGRYSTDNTYYLVEEIVGIIFDIDMPKTIAFINPDFVKNDIKDDSVRGGAGGVNWQNSGDELEIDDEQSASDENETLVFDGDLSWVSFTKPFDVYKQERVKEVDKLIIDESAEKEGGKQVSTDEPHQGGTLPAADVGGKQDITDQSRQFASRFQSFDHMLQVLVAQHQCVILKQETLPLSKVGRSKQHLLENGSARAIKAVRLKRKTTEAVLLEVDTSDGIKMLSTKVIYDSNASDWIDHFSQIRKGVVANSISWPNDVFDRIFGKNQHLGVHHPKHQGSQAGNIPVDALESWASRIASAL